MEPTPGAMLTANIRLERALARGGMGSVWLADHLGLHTKVVVKFIAEEVSKHPDVIARFQREAAAASQVKSQHVVQMLDHGVTPLGLAYIAMELLEGCALAEYLDAQPIVPAQQVAHVLGQVAKALGRAHEKGVVHRDIKPDNIFLCDGGDGEAFVKVLDFGIAKMANSGGLDTTRTGAMLGTPYYMSPEQIMGVKNLDHRADLWALAVVAYEMLTGTRPFDGETMGAISVRICAAEFEPAVVRNAALATLGSALDSFLSKALARDINQRFDSARAFAEALEHAAGGSRPLQLTAALRAKALTAIGPNAPKVATGPTGTVSSKPGVASVTPAPTYMSTVASSPGFVPIDTPQSPKPVRSPAIFVGIGVLVLGATVGLTVALVRPTKPMEKDSEAEDKEGVAKTPERRDSKRTKAEPATADPIDSPPGKDTPPVGMAKAGASVETPTSPKSSGPNDGDDAARPILSPADDGFVDSRGGWGWGDRCWVNLKAGKLGWAKAECLKAMELNPASPNPRASLLYNLGLIENKAGKNIEARKYFEQSLAIRENREVRAALDALP